MESVFHKASQRGFADHGWLKATHSFSFANYYDSEKTQFGKLRVLNDDEIDPGKGFDLHPHQNMEIVTIPLSGAVRHGDNMGNEEIISVNDVQVMSAGSGIFHTEYNASEKEVLNLLQIWILTNKKGHRPRYEQKTFNVQERVKKWQLLVSPKSKNSELWIHQDAYLSIIETKDLPELNYELKKQGNGVYLMVLEGGAEIRDFELSKRDAVGLWGFFDPLLIRPVQNSKLLAIEVPMH